jgi:hypothetical protein
MKILFTNHSLVGRAGTEVWVRDMALAMLRRGHDVAAYSTALGPVAEEMQEHGVVAVGNLNDLPWKPDVIHGHHHLETMTAIVHFGSVPAIYVCHGVAPWQEAPPLHPRIMRYAAVSRLVRDTAARWHGIPPERISLLLNFVDLERFQLRPSLSEQPRRALLFSNEATPEFIYPEVLAGCDLCGVALDTVGRGMGHTTEEPEKVLGHYDLVFAMGRSALEAMACGAAVVVCGITGAGPLVDTSLFDQLRRLNFGIGCITSRLTAEAIAQQIGRYDASEATRVAGRVRQEAGLDRTAQDLLRLYNEATAEFGRTPLLSGSPDAAAAAYIADLARLLTLFQGRRNRDRREKTATAPGPGPSSNVPQDLRQIKRASERIVSEWRRDTAG